MEIEEATWNISKSMYLTKIGGIKNKLHTLMLILRSARRCCVLYTWDQNRMPLGSREHSTPNQTQKHTLASGRSFREVFIRLEIFQGDTYFISLPDSPLPDSHLSIQAWALTQSLSLHSDDCSMNITELIL